MDQNLDKNTGFKENFINFLKEKKIFIFDYFCIIFGNYNYVILRLSKKKRS